MLKSEWDDLCFQSYLRVIEHPHPFNIHGSLASKCSRQLWKSARLLTLCILIFSSCLVQVGRESWKKKILLAFWYGSRTWKFLEGRRAAPPGPGCGDTVWCLWYSQGAIPKCDGSQSWLAIPMRWEGGQIPLFCNVYCPDNRVPQKWSCAVLGTGSEKVATSPCLEQFTEEGIETVWWESWSWVMTAKNMLVLYFPFIPFAGGWFAWGWMERTGEAEGECWKNESCSSKATRFGTPASCCFTHCCSCSKYYFLSFSFISGGWSTQLKKWFHFHDFTCVGFKPPYFSWGSGLPNTLFQCLQAYLGLCLGPLQRPPFLIISQLFRIFSSRFFTEMRGCISHSIFQYLNIQYYPLHSGLICLVSPFECSL